MPERFAEGLDPEAVGAMNIAFDKVCEALNIPPTHDYYTEKIARMVVEQARTGERDPVKLYPHDPAGLCWPLRHPVTCYASPGVYNRIQFESKAT